MKPSLLMMKPVPAATATCSRGWLPLALALPRPLAAEEALEQVVAAAAEELGELLRPLPRFGADVDDRRADGLGDVAERAGVDRPAERRAVGRRRRTVGCAIDGGDRSSRDAMHHADGERRDRDQQSVEHRRFPTRH